MDFDWRGSSYPSAGERRSRRPAGGALSRRGGCAGKGSGRPLEELTSRGGPERKSFTVKVLKHYDKILYRCPAGSVFGVRALASEAVVADRDRLDPAGVLDPHPSRVLSSRVPVSGRTLRGSYVPDERA